MPDVIQGSVTIALEYNSSSFFTVISELGSCENPGTPENGATEVNSTRIGSVVTFSCNIGYFVKGALSVICNPDGEWSAEIPECVKGTHLIFVYLSVRLRKFFHLR